MNILYKLGRVGAVLCTLLIVAACADPNGATSRGAVSSSSNAQYTPPPMGTQAEMDKLAAAIQALSPQVDPAEAQRAARTAYVSTQQQAIAYQITASPLVHNMMVNSGLRDRGLCYQWADDLEIAMKKEGFRTLSLHRAIANAFNPLLIEHSTLIISAKGAAMQEGIVLDPWRKGGILTWKPVVEDTKYTWVPQAEVFARKLRKY